MNINAGNPDLGKLNFGLPKLKLNLVAVKDRGNSYEFSGLTNWSYFKTAHNVLIIRCLPLLTSALAV